LRDKIFKYNLYHPANKLNQIIAERIRENTLVNHHNLSGKVSYDNGIEVFKEASLFTFWPYLGPMVKLNIKCHNSNTNGTESKLILERKNGLTFLLHYWFSLIFALLTFGLGVYLLIENGVEKIEVLFLPIFGFGYYYLIKILANGTTKNLISKVEKMLRKEKIKYEKL